MNTSINYSGFVDLLEIAASEKFSGADQQEGVQQEQDMDLTVQLGLGGKHALTEVSGPD